MKTFGSKIKEARLKLNLTQEELARKIGIAKSTLSLYENDKREPNVAMIKLLAQGLNIDCNYLIGISDSSGNIGFNFDVSVNEKENPDSNIIVRICESELRNDEKELLQDYNMLDDDDKQTVRMTTNTITQKSKYEVLAGKESS